MTSVIMTSENMEFDPGKMKDDSTLQGDAEILIKFETAHKLEPCFTINRF